MASTPAFAVTPRFEYANVALANTALDGTGANFVEVIAGATNGTRVDEVHVKLAATSAAANVRLWLSKDGGTTKRLYWEFPITAVTPSNTVPSFAMAVSFSNLILPSTSTVLYATTTIAQSTNVMAFGADF